MKIPFVQAILAAPGRSFDINSLQLMSTKQGWPRFTDKMIEWNEEDDRRDKKKDNVNVSRR